MKTLCLWYDGTAEEAAAFYAATFPDSSVGSIQRAPSDNPSTPEGAVLVVEMTLLGMPAILLNGGSTFKHSEAFSIQIHTEDQAETDRLWNAITSDGGAESMCGLCKEIRSCEDVYSSPQIDEDGAHHKLAGRELSNVLSVVLPDF